MTTPAARPIPDVQGRPDSRGLGIDRVGISDLRYPITILDRANAKREVLATIEAAVSLAEDVKGAHMSRFLEVLNRHRGEMTMRILPAILEDLRGHMGAADASIKLRFHYFVERSAPVSGMSAPMDYECAFEADDRGGDASFVLSVEVPVTSVCPCSKEISDYGAHNQRGYATLRVRSRQDERGEHALIWIEELIELAERSASAPVYPLLKRGDERHVTMQAYENPVFVEDMVRGMAEELGNDKRVAWYSVEVVNHESIHNHDVFARIARSAGDSREELSA